MHFKRKSHKGAVVAVVLLALAAGLAFAAWWFWPVLADSAQEAWGSLQEPAAQATAQAPSASARLTGMLLSVTPESNLAPDALEAALESQLAFAAEHGCTAVFVSVKESQTIFYRDRHYSTMPSVTEEDSFFHHYDPLKTLCVQAAKKGLSVYALYDSADFSVPSLSDAEAVAALKALKKSVEHLRRSYAVADVYVRAGTAQTELRYIAYADTAKAQPDPLYLLSADTAVFAEPGLLTVSLLDPSCAGVVFSYAPCAAQQDSFGYLASALDDGAQRPSVLEYAPAQALSVTYPRSGALLTSETLYIMGTSDPSAALTLNGTAVERTAASGAFGVLVTLTEGENIFTLVQGSNSTVLSVTYQKPQTSSGGTLASDGTAEVPSGTRIRVSNWIASLLYDPSSDSNISETVRQGGTATVTQCATTVRSGKKTWAYQLESGDYILAYNTKLAPEAADTVFTGAVATPVSSGETLLFSGAGTPLAYTDSSGNDLTLHFYGASADPGFAISGSSMVQGCTVNPLENGVELILHFAAPLYGWSIEYADGATQLYLQRTPVQSATFGKPLEGISVLLDAGHGADDSGAIGVAGTDAPMEKDVNLAVTLAAKYRLEQLGATVFTVRTDDTFLTLTERNQMILSVRPDFFLAIHHNSVELVVDANLSSGTECYYFYDSGKPLAEALTKNISAAVERENRGAAWGYYYVTRSTLCPAVLLELGFMVNPAEYDSIASVPDIWREGDAIAQSILSCVAKNSAA